MVIGCTEITTTITPDFDPATIPMFGAFPVILKEIRLMKEQHFIWQARHIGGNYMIDPNAANPVVNLDTTYTLVVVLQDDFILPSIYKTIEMLLTMHKRRVFLMRSGAFTLNSTPVIHHIYQLQPMDLDGWTYTKFESIDGAVKLSIQERDPMLLTPIIL